MQLLITGASGFLGQAVVMEALRRGHEVIAVRRSPAAVSSTLAPLPPTAQDPLLRSPLLRWIAADLRSPQALQALQPDLAQADGVIHLAAAKSGSLEQQWLDTVGGTERLLEAIAQLSQPLAGLVAISSFSVYDWLALPTGAWLDETSPLESQPQYRDVYAQVKLAQEARVQAFAAAHPATAVTILRPGIIFDQAGQDGAQNWNAHLGAKLGPLYLRIGREATLPLIEVGRCAEAVVRAAEQALLSSVLNLKVPNLKVLNLVDDELPTQAEYWQQLKQRAKHQGQPLPRTIPLAWSLLQPVAGLVFGIQQRLLGGRVPLPGILIPARIAARFKPLRFSNAQAKAVGFRFAQRQPTAPH